MSVRIRLTRMGRKKTPHYRIVVMDSRSRRDGAYLDQIGIYSPACQPARVEIDENRALHWLRTGAQPSETVRSLLASRGVMLQFHLMKRNTPAEKIAEIMARWKEAAAAREARRSAQHVRKRKSGAQEVAPPQDAVASS